MPARRDCIAESTPAENAIRTARDCVEAMGADERLTQAINLLGMARELVGDYVDGIASNQGWKRDIILGRTHEQSTQPKKCEECDVNYADPPSKLCPGCQAYRDHQR